MSLELVQKFIFQDEESLGQWISQNLSLFRPGGLFLLSGDLGAGKTTFVSHVVQTLGGLASEVSSPTFALHHVYQVGPLIVDHMDLYRIENESDLMSSGFFEVIEEEDHLVFVEWSDKLSFQFYKNFPRAHFVFIQLLEEGKRELALKRWES